MRAAHILLRLLSGSRHRCRWPSTVPTAALYGRSRLTGAATRSRAMMASIAAAAAVEPAGHESDCQLPLARVRLLEEATPEPLLSIELEVDGKQRSFNRPASAPLDATLRRMQLSLSVKKKKKKVKKSKAQRQAEQEAAAAADEQPPAAVLRGSPGGAVLEGLTNAEAWHSGAVLELEGHGAWRVEACIPHVISLRVPGASRAMVGLPLRPNIALEHADAAADCQWQWARTVDSKLEGESAQPGQEQQQQQQQQQLLSEEPVYTPTESDRGYALSVRCIPTRNAAIHPDSLPATFSTAPVTGSDLEGAVAGICMPELRRAWVAGASAAEEGDTTAVCRSSSSSSGGFRVMCYNILANVYGNTAEAREELFPYCPAAALDIEYRAQLVIREIIAAQADIVCLQEVDRAVFEEYLRSAWSPYLDHQCTFANSPQNGQCMVLYRSAMGEH